MAEQNKQSRTALNRLLSDEAERKAAAAAAKQAAEDAAKERAKDKDSWENTLARVSPLILKTLGDWDTDLKGAGLEPKLRDDIVPLDFRDLRHARKHPPIQIGRLTFFRDVDAGQWAREYVMVAFASQADDDLKRGDVVALYSIGRPHDVTWTEQGRWPIDDFDIEFVDPTVNDIIDLARASRARSR